jgi:DNA-binding CsgD family transcriptional regulator
MTNKNKILPGILNDEIEFFVDDEKVKAICNGKVLDFTEISFGHIQMLKDEIERDREVKLHLLDLHPHSEYRRIEQFVKCRFGGLDYQADISSEGIQKGEHWDCPLRGHCRSEGVLCKSVTYNGETLNAQDIALTKLLSTNFTNEAIAQELNIPLGSLHLAKKNLYKKYGVQTKQETTIKAQRLNII